MYNNIKLKNIYCEYSGIDFEIFYFFKKYTVYLINDTFSISIALGSIRRNITEKSFSSIIKYFKMDATTLREIIKNKTLSNFKKNY